MSTLDFTGERFVPGIPGEIVYEHWHRYAFAQGLVQSKRVLDVACGEGYGSALLAKYAMQVTGVDISLDAVSHATVTYAAQNNIRFIQGSAATLPLPDASVDVVVSFETIEHLPQTLQQQVIREFSRVLTADGFLVISSPNRPEYSPSGSPPNPFHLHELDRSELAELLEAYFPSQSWWSQRLWFGSMLRQEAQEVQSAQHADVWVMRNGAMEITRAEVPAAKYFLVLAAKNQDALPKNQPPISLFSDDEDAELKRLYHHSAEVLRLDKLAITFLESLERQTRESKSLERLLDGRIKELNDRDQEITRLSGVLAQEQEKLVQTENLLRYRTSWCGWLRLPLSKVRQFWRA